MSITWNEASKCLKFLMRVLITKEGDKYRPAKDTGRQDAYRALYEIQEALGTGRIEREEALLENMQDLDLAFSDLLTRGEIIGAYEKATVDCGLAASQGDEEAAKSYEILKAGLNALRTPTREMVERMRREWTHTHSTDNSWTEVLKCSYCGFEDDHGCCFDFCPDCGTPMTDEAVEMVMERLEVLKDE